MKKIMTIASIALLSTAIFTGCSSNEAEVETTEEQSSIEQGYYANPTVSNADEALELLKEGNKRFVENELVEFDLGDDRLAELEDGQSPFAIVVACADSRVAPELFLNQGLGEIFVVRVAGNIVDANEIASIEYAAANLGTPLIAVLGHESCGAVYAATDVHEDLEGAGLTDSLNHLVRKIEPAVIAAKESGVDESEVAEKAIDINIENVIAELTERSPILQEKVDSGEMEIVGGNYRFSTGEVIWNK